MRLTVLLSILVFDTFVFGAARASAQPAIPPPPAGRYAGGCRPASADAARHHLARRPGRATVRAVRVTTPMRVDGRLDEAVYSRVHPASGFIQMEPNGRSAGHREDRGLGLLRRRQRLRQLPGVGEPARRSDRQRDAARQQQHPPGRLGRVLVRHVPRSPQRHPVRGQLARRPHRSAEHERAAVQPGLESGVDASTAGTLRRRLDD